MWQAGHEAERSWTTGAGHDERYGKGAGHGHTGDDASSLAKFDEALGLVREIGHEHGLAWSAVESRFHYRGNPVVHVVVGVVASPM